MTDTTKTEIGKRYSGRVGRNYKILRKDVGEVIRAKSYKIIGGPQTDTSVSLWGDGFYMTFFKIGEETDFEVETTSEEGGEIWRTVIESGVLKEWPAGKLPLESQPGYQEQVKKLLVDVVQKTDISPETICRKYTVQRFVLDFYPYLVKTDVYQLFKDKYEADHKTDEDRPEFDAEKFYIELIVNESTLRKWCKPDDVP